MPPSADPSRSGFRRWWGPGDLRVDFEHDYGVNVSLGHGVEVMLAWSRNGTLEVWAVNINGVVYREPRDLEGEKLQAGAFADLIAKADEKAQ